MTESHLWEVALLVVGAVVAGLVQAFFASKKDQGRRIGRLEKLADFERGRQAGLREARRRMGDGR